MLRGVLTRRSRLRDPDGRIVARHPAALREHARSAPRAGSRRPSSPRTGRAGSRCAARSTARCATPASPATRSLPDQHLVPLRTDRENDEVVCLHVETNQSHVRIAEAARTRLFRDGRAPRARAGARRARGLRRARVRASTSKPARRSSSRRSCRSSRRATTGISEPGEEACDWLMHMAGDFDELLERHVVSWRHSGAATRIELGTRRRRSRRSLHLHALPPAPDGVEQLGRARRRRPGAWACTARPTAGTCSGTSCSSSRSSACASRSSPARCCSYRYRRLDQARRGCRRTAGYAGAMFPWQSASNGREETQTMHLNPVSGRWLPDASHLQRHVNAAIALQHVAVLPGDRRPRVPALLRRRDDPRDRAVLGQRRDLQPRARPLRDQGRDGARRVPRAAIPTATSRASTTTPTRTSWRCGACAGPSTCSSCCPPSSAQRAEGAARRSPSRSSTGGATSAARCGCASTTASSASSRATSCSRSSTGTLPAQYGDIERLDRILEAEGDSPNRYQLTKQADVMMLLLPALGRRARRAARAPRLRLRRRAHRPHASSTTSRAPRTARRSAGSCTRGSTRAATASSRGSSSSRRCTATSTTPGRHHEGGHPPRRHGRHDRPRPALLHRARDPGRHPALRPDCPRGARLVAFTIRYRGHLVHLEFTPTVARVRVDLDEGAPITVVIRGEQHELVPGELLEVDLTSARAELREPLAHFGSVIRRSGDLGSRRRDLVLLGCRGCTWVVRPARGRRAGKDRP